MTNEKQIQQAILIALGKHPDRCRAWRSQSGVFRTIDGRGMVRVGVPGCADITGILSDGRRLELEVKTKTSRQSEQQKKFQRMIDALGGVYAVVRSVDDALLVIGA